MDDLVGLKENVILGKLIPAGTGLQNVRETQVVDDRLLERVSEVTDVPRERRGDRPVGAPSRPQSPAVGD